MKDDKVCFNKTWTYLVLLVAVVFGAFWMVKYSNTQNLGGTPKAAGIFSNAVRYPYLDGDNKLIVPRAGLIWEEGRCEYRSRSYKVGSVTLSENAFTGYISSSNTLVKSNQCFPFIYGQRDLKAQQYLCSGDFGVISRYLDNSKYCLSNSNIQGSSKNGSLYYGYDDGNGGVEQIYQVMAPKVYQTPVSEIASTKSYIYKYFNTNKERTFEGFPAYFAETDTIKPTSTIKACVYNGSVINFADNPALNDYYISGIFSGTNVEKDKVYSVKQQAAGVTSRLTAIQCIPTSTGVANAVSWRSNGGTTTNDLNLQTCKDNAVKTYQVTVGGVSQTKTMLATCKYKTGSGVEVSVSYGNFILNPDGTNTNSKY